MGGQTTSQGPWADDMVAPPPRYPAPQLLAGELPHAMPLFTGPAFGSGSRAEGSHLPAAPQLQPPAWQFAGSTLQGARQALSRQDGTAQSAVSQAAASFTSEPAQWHTASAAPFAVSGSSQPGSQPEPSGPRTAYSGQLQQISGTMLQGLPLLPPLQNTPPPAEVGSDIQEQAHKRRRLGEGELPLPGLSLPPLCMPLPVLDLLPPSSTVTSGLRSGAPLNGGGGFSFSGGGGLPMRARSATMPSPPLFKPLPLAEPSPASAESQQQQTRARRRQHSAPPVALRRGARHSRDVAATKEQQGREALAGPSATPSVSGGSGGAASGDLDQDGAPKVGPDWAPAGRRGRKARKHDHITVEMLNREGYLDLPVQDAAKKLNLGLSVLKRVCREIGLVRWPYRKRKSLENVISKTHAFLAEEQKAEVLAELEQQLAGMTGEGEQFEQATKSYRQSIFKLNHKMNKLASLPEGTPIKNRSRAVMKIPLAAAARLTQRAELSSSRSPEPLPANLQAGAVPHAAVGLLSSRCRPCGS